MPAVRKIGTSGGVHFCKDTWVPFRDADDSVWRRIGMVRGCLALLREDNGRGDWKDVVGGGDGIVGASACAFHQSWADVEALMPAVREMLAAAEKASSRIYGGVPGSIVVGENWHENTEKRSWRWMRRYSRGRIVQ